MKPHFFCACELQESSWSSRFCASCSQIWYSRTPRQVSSSDTDEPDGLRRSRSARRGARTDGGGVHRGERPPAPRSKRVPSQIWPCFRELPSHDAVRLTPVPSSDEQTTIMACVYDGGVVLGADSRTSTGNYVANRASDKITQVMDNVWMCRSGSVRAPPLPFPTRPTRSPRRCDTSPASRSLVSNPRMTTPRLSPFVADPSD